jgi:hypothetical protein
LRSLELMTEEVQVWVAPLEVTEARYTDLASTLAVEERRRADDMPPVLARRFVVARGILRDLLSGFTGTPAQKLKFEYGSAGKPSLVDHDINFNISHSAELGLFAFGPPSARRRPTIHVGRRGPDVGRYRARTARRELPQIVGGERSASQGRRKEHLVRTGRLDQPWQPHPQALFTSSRVYRRCGCLRLRLAAVHMRGKTLARLPKTLTLKPVAPTGPRHAFAARVFAATVYQPLIYRLAPA